MEQFQFQLDQKVSVWYRTKFNVEGNTLEEAKENLKKLIQDKKLDEVTSGIPWELIDDHHMGALDGSHKVCALRWINF
jgi:hypothetical protein